MSKSIPTYPPTYQPGDMICSKFVAGIIDTASWFEDEWLYHIKGLAVSSSDAIMAKDGTITLGLQSVKESEVRWFHNGMPWQEVVKKEERA